MYLHILQCVSAYMVGHISFSFYNISVLFLFRFLPLIVIDGTNLGILISARFSCWDPSETVVLVCWDRHDEITATVQTAPTGLGTPLEHGDMLAEGMSSRPRHLVGYDLEVGSEVSLLRVLCDVRVRPEVSLLRCECDAWCDEELVCTHNFLDEAGHVA